MSTSAAIAPPAPAANAFTTAIEMAAAQYGLDAGSLRACLTFVAEHLCANPAACDLFAHGTDEERSAILTAGVTAWREQSEMLLWELHSGTTPRAQAIRREIADDVYTRLRAKAANAARDRNDATTSWAT